MFFAADCSKGEIDGRFNGNHPKATVWELHPPTELRQPTQSPRLPEKSSEAQLFDGYDPGKALR